jgi:hypothetical protein
MTSFERFQVAIHGGRPDRVPVAPKIWIDLAARLTNTPLRDVLADPRSGWLACGVRLARLGLPQQHAGENPARHFPRVRLETDLDTFLPPGD